MPVLIDTSIFIDYLRQKDKAGTVLSLLLSRDIDPAISLVTVGELYAGLSSVTQTDEIERLLGIGEMIALDVDSARSGGKIARDTGIGLLDGFIAATALQMDYPLATLNTKDFRKVRGVKPFPLKET